VRRETKLDMDADTIITSLERFYEKLDVYKGVLLVSGASDAEVYQLIARLQDESFPAKRVISDDVACVEHALEDPSYRLMVVRLQPGHFLDHVLLGRFTTICNFVGFVSPKHEHASLVEHVSQLALSHCVRASRPIFFTVLG
jgi:hypothetical protein